MAHNRELAQLAQPRGLSVGLKNDIDQAAVLQPDFDFAVNEQCSQYKECSALAPFVAAGKAAFHAEYEAAYAKPVLGQQVILKQLSLDAWLQRV